MTQDTPRRLVLRVAAKLLGLAGVLALIYVLFDAAGGRGDERPVRGEVFDLSGLAPGTARRLEWNGRRLWVVHRSPRMLAQVERPTAALKQERDRWGRLPPGVHPRYRSSDPRFLVVLDYGTELGCPLEFVPWREEAADGWRGGFQDRCRGSRYDFAGRVLRSSSAPRNLNVPPHVIGPGPRLVLGGA